VKYYTIFTNIFIEVILFKKDYIFFRLSLLFKFINLYFTQNTDSSKNLFHIKFDICSDFEVSG